MENKDTFTSPGAVGKQAGKAREDARSARIAWTWDIVLVIILVIGAYFRFVGVNWDQNQHLHPDERFLTMVETSIQPVSSFAEYFDTARSTLNPHNRGYGFYVYGTLPLFAVRYVGEWLGQTGYDEIHIVGRQLSAAADLGTIFVVYLIAATLFRDRRVGLLAAAFAAFSALPIQLAHYFTVESFTNFFGVLAFYFAVRLLPGYRKDEQPSLAQEDEKAAGSAVDKLLRNWSSLWPYVLFGAALGMAVSSKINAAALAILLPGAVFVRWLSHSPAERERWALLYLRNLAVAAVVSLLIFRIFQPYAFSGPGFFGIQPNQLWVDNIRDQRAQASGDVDFPPALQWARRPFWFAFQHLTLWGLGLPLGLLAWAGFAWMGWRIARSLKQPGGEWQRLILPWAWTAFYFLWQSSSWNPTMRYFLLVYPTLAITAAWAVFALWERFPRGSRLRLIAALLGVAVLGMTFAWAFAFTRIYTRPVTRVEASRWIYQNVPGPINLKIDAGGQLVNQPLAFRSGLTLRSNSSPLVLAFSPRKTGELSDLTFEHIGSSATGSDITTLMITVSEQRDGSNPMAAALLADTFQPGGDPRGKSYIASFDPLPDLDPQKTYYFVITVMGQQRSLNIAGPVTASLVTPSGAFTQALPEPVNALREGDQYELNFVALKAGTLREVRLTRVVDWEGYPEQKTLRLHILSPESGDILSTAELRDPFAARSDVRGEEAAFLFEAPVNLDDQRLYALRLEFVDGPGALAVYGSKQANESSWDDALPVGLDGYNPYDYQQGVYRSDLNFEMYWDDNADKLKRFLSVLDQADYLFISSNRQWGTTTRVPERYPLTTEYYRQLVGCPPEREVTWCYSVAEPGRFSGGLGFELAAVFQSDPNLGSLRFNSQFAEEAFTVYDHPKVLIFRKTESYDPDRVKAILESVDLSLVVHLTPRKASQYPGNLLLPAGRLAQQRAGGTWSALFDTGAVYNRLPGLGAALWYLVITLLGWVTYPFTRLALRGLPDRGFPFARLVGLLALAYPVWLLGSSGVPFTSLTITLVFCGLAAASIVLAYTHRESILQELRARWKSLLTVEALILAFFLLFLLVRLGNPDLWHPWKGGEKPMDFSYFNAVLKSTTFPPYDPWFAGGYINYYYYGFVVVGVPVKWLGIVPSIAYNLILPTLFAMLAIGAFSVGWNLLSATQSKTAPSFNGIGALDTRGPLMAGIASAVAVTVIGNWGTVRMIWHGLQRLANMQIPFEEAGLVTRLGWTFEGITRLLSVPGTRLPYGPSDWYWIPSRAIPGEPITEFPAFTFLYADLHAHMIALPVTVLALAWSLSVLLGRFHWRGWTQPAAALLLGGLVIGALRPTNTWDWPTYTALGAAAIAYTALRYGQVRSAWIKTAIRSQQAQRWLVAVLAVGLLILLSLLLYQPFSAWYGQGYNQIEPWTENHTPFWSYMTHWGVFLFIIIFWMFTETVDWMSRTPVSALNRLCPYAGLIRGAAAALALLVIGLLLIGVQVAWLALPLAAWAGVLLLRPGMPDVKRAVLFLIGTALVLTLFVEVARLRGDIGRMNTVFKFYLQAWTLFAVSAGAAVIWFLQYASTEWRPRWQTAWQAGAALLVSGALLFPVMAGMDKISDRMSGQAPATLDGMTYMAYSSYREADSVLDLSQDYRAIRWMQENVEGSPVIVEAHLPEYRWGTRYTIYTGLPGVVGWNWHQRQQRAVTPSEWVNDRVDAIAIFYHTRSRQIVEEFLQRYRPGYVIVGGLEKATYSQTGLEKFELWNGDLWNEVYRDGDTVIYKVLYPGDVVGLQP